MQSPFENIRLLEISTGIAGSYTAMLLADMGIEVIKIEPPQGDCLRSLPGFLVWNRGKKSLTLDLETSKGREILALLAEQVDIVVESYSPTEAKRQGMDYETLATRNEKLVYLAITPFIEPCKPSERLADDGVISAISGQMTYQGGPDEPPVYLIQPFSSNAAAVLGAIGVTTALYAKEDTGKGQKVEVSLLSGAVSLMATSLVYGENVATRPGRGHIQQGTWPTCRLFECQDDWIVVAAFTATQWHKLCIALNREELASDPRFENAPYVAEDENIAALVSILSEAFKSKSKNQWLEILENNDIPCGPVSGLEDLLNDVQTINNQMVVKIKHPTVGPVKQMGIPIKLENTPGKIKGPAPLLGEHNESVLAWLGYSSTEIKGFTRAGVI